MSYKLSTFTGGCIPQILQQKDLKISSKDLPSNPSIKGLPSKPVIQQFTLNLSNAGFTLKPFLLEGFTLKSFTEFTFKLLTGFPHKTINKRTYSQIYQRITLKPLAKGFTYKTFIQSFYSKINQWVTFKLLANDLLNKPFIGGFTLKFFNERIHTETLWSKDTSSNNLQDLPTKTSFKGFTNESFCDITYAYILDNFNSDFNFQMFPYINFNIKVVSDHSTDHHLFDHCADHHMSDHYVNIIQLFLFVILKYAGYQKKH